MSPTKHKYAEMGACKQSCIEAIIGGHGGRQRGESTHEYQRERAHDRWPSWQVPAGLGTCPYNAPHMRKATEQRVLFVGRQDDETRNEATAANDTKRPNHPIENEATRPGSKLRGGTRRVVPRTAEPREEDLKTPERDAPRTATAQSRTRTTETKAPRQATQGQEGRSRKGKEGKRGRAWRKACATGD